MLDIIWIVFCAALVFLMQAGFTCLEAGMVRNKNSINVAVKNVMDLCLSGAIFWVFGYGLMNGTSHYGLFGSDHFAPSEELAPFEYGFILFQLMFCGTATTIVSGAVAERMSFVGYMFTTALVASCIYPITGHWAWSGHLTGEAQGWLDKMGFIDFAGSTVVHSVGGWSALSAILIIGPRIGRFTNHHKIPGSNLPLSVMGALILWFGWFGFNGGSTLSASDTIPLILLNTSLSGIFGGLSAAIYLLITTKQADVPNCINGVLGGLVAITASCHIMTPLSAALIGATAGVLVCIGGAVLESYKIDDVVGAIPVHLFCGIWGTLAFPFLSSPESWGTGLTFWQQSQAQLIGTLSIGLYAFSVSFVMLKMINRVFPLRVSEEAELQGLNFSEHQATTEIYNLMEAMHRQEKEGDFGQAVYEEPFSEVGQIARQYNHVLEEVNKEITDRDEAINAFQQSQSRKGAILNSALDCIVTIDINGLIQEFNMAAEKCFGLSYQKVFNRNFIELFIPQKMREDFFASLNSHFSINTQLALNNHNQITLQRVHEIQFPAELSITQVDLNNGLLTEFTFHIRDITKRMAMQNKMQKLAFQDALTGLYNRNYFKEKLTQEIAFANRYHSNVLLMFIDLDHFKNINDTFGHDAGDQLLLHVAKLLKTRVRGDDVLCRWGGDEFIIMFMGLEKHKSASDKAQEITDTLRNPLSIQGRELYAQTSIGIAISKEGKINAELLIQHADMAMYEAKKQGKNRFCFFLPEMEEKNNYRNYYEKELRDTIKNNEFVLYYQPKVDCKNGHIVGFEALLRWMHPKMGLTPPNVFIPILEDSTLINDVTHWVLQDVCQQLSFWRAKGLPLLPVAINLSAKDLLLDDCYERVRDALKKFNIQGQFLEIEITETMLAKNTEQCIALMNRLKKLDITFSVDDFGTGYSSMSYLKKFPLDTLKIDIEFIRECTINSEDRAICNAIIALGKSLKLKIIAEGIETQEQLEFLKQTDCNIYQGFLFSKPLPVADVEILLLEKVKYDLT